MADEHRDGHLYEERQELPSPWEWVILVAFSASLVGFGWLVYLLVPDGPRRWDFGQLPDAPAESIYSTTRSPAGEPKRQLRPLPEAQPLPSGASAPAERGKAR